MSTQKLFQIGACVISARKAKHFDVTTLFTYSHANTPLGQSECTYYLSDVIVYNIDIESAMCCRCCGIILALV